MSKIDEDDKPTVVLDLNLLKKQKLKEEEQLAALASELEFATEITKIPESLSDEMTLTTMIPSAKPVEKIKVILFDLQGNFFHLAKNQLPSNYDYHYCTNLNELNTHIRVKKFQIVVFNYDQNPKAINALSAQLKQKFAHCQVMIMARAISPEKAKIHAQTPAGAAGYYQLPLDADRLDKEFQRMQGNVKKVA